MIFKSMLLALTCTVVLMGSQVRAEEGNRADTEGALKAAPAGTVDDANVVKAKEVGGEASQVLKKTAGKAAKAVKTAGGKVAKGAKAIARHPVKSAKSAGAKISRSTKNAVAKTKAAAARRHEATLARAEANDASHAPCDRAVTDKSGNAVGNPCMTTATYAKSRGLTQKQVAKARTAKGAKGVAKKRATH